jgi:hypothetical protein
MDTRAEFARTIPSSYPFFQIMPKTSRKRKHAEQSTALVLGERTRGQVPEPDAEELALEAALFGGAGSSSKSKSKAKRRAADEQQQDDAMEDVLDGDVYLKFYLVLGS